MTDGFTLLVVANGSTVSNDASLGEQTEKHLLRTQNVSERNPKHKCCVRNKCSVLGQTGKHFVSATMCPRLSPPLENT